jgi:carboxymethylenebutenolidase
MGKMIELTAADGHKLAAYRADPTGKPRGAVVVIQEIFGVNSHIKAQADGYAKDGYVAIAPAMFDRLQRGYDTGYSQPEIQAGIAMMQKLDWKNTMMDAQAAIDEAKKAGKVGIVGYCWGGLLVWRAAEKVSGLSAAVSYYGGGMTAGTEPSRKPAVPTMSHFGELDTHITVASVKAFEQAHPEVEVHLYDANHGFNCDQRGAYNAGAAATALERSLFHFGKHVARA